MKDSALNKVISIVRNYILSEEMMTTSSPTNSTNPPDKINIAGLPPQDPPVRKTKRYIYGIGFRKNWLQKRTKPKE